MLRHLRTGSGGWLVVLASAIVFGMLPASGFGSPGAILVTNTNDSGLGSLRAAIEFANTDLGPDVIAFAIPPTDPGFNGQWFTIQPLSPLPPLTDDGTTIDGSTQSLLIGDTNPAGPEIELNGADAGITSGLVVNSSGNRIDSLVVNGFQGGASAGGGGNGIELHGSANTLQGDYIGTNAAGTVAVPNQFNGVTIFGNANTVGGTTAGAGNLISGNDHGGVAVSNFLNPSQTISGTTIQGNLIGTNAEGTAAIPNGEKGLALSGASSTLVGGTVAGARNVISANTGHGIVIGPEAGSNDNAVEGNYVGTNIDGTAALPNTDTGIIVNGSNNSIGGMDAGARNVISGNARVGVSLLSDGNVVLGNYIGTNAAGTGAVANGDGSPGAGGVGVQADNNTVATNLISGNNTNGISIGPLPGGSAASNIFQGNLIGTDASGTAPLANIGAGINVFAASGTTIGGTSADARNVISGNGGGGIGIGGATTGTLIQGNYIGTNASGTAALGNDDGIFIGTFHGTPTDTTIGGSTPGAGNLISGNSGGGIHTFAFPTFPGNISGLVVQGNKIGTDASGTHPLPNGPGLALFNTTGPVIGGTSAGARNLISGNRGDGITLNTGTTGALVRGNWIGTDASGNVALGNGNFGINDFGTNNTIGGATAGARNVIAGSGFKGVGLGIGGTFEGNYVGTNATGTAALPNKAGVGGSSDSRVIGNVISGNAGSGIDAGAPGGITNLTVQGNLVGTNAAGVLALPNNGDGIALTGVSSSQIRGNLVSGNGAVGIDVFAGSAGSTGNTIAGNFVGVDATGMSAVANGGAGISLLASGGGAPANNVIGGATAADRNIISGNGGQGVIIIGGSPVTGNVVRGNYIGVAADGSTPLGNARSGVAFVGPGPTANIVDANTIGYNLVGVAVVSGVANAISRNSILGNIGLGIDLAPGGVTGVTLNDPGDTDTGPNNLQNFPVLRAAAAARGQLVVHGSIDTPNPQTVTIEFFANAVPFPGADPSGYGEGQTFLGTATPNRVGEFTATLPPVPRGTVISATATDAEGNTSEFCADIVAK